MPLPYDYQPRPSNTVTSDENEVHLLVPTVATLATAGIGGEIAARTHNTREEKAADLAKSFAQRSAQALEEDLNYSVQLRTELESLLKDFKTKDEVLKKFDNYADKWREYHEQLNIIKQPMPDVNMEIEALESKLDANIGIKPEAAITRFKKYANEGFGMEISTEQLHKTFAKLEETKNMIVNSQRQILVNQATEYFRNKDLPEAELAPHKANLGKLYRGELEQQVLELINKTDSYEAFAPKINNLLDEKIAPLLDETFETLKMSAIKRTEHMEIQKVATNAAKNIKIMELPKAGEIFASALKTMLAHGSLALPVIAATTAVGATTAYLCNQNHHR